VAFLQDKRRVEALLDRHKLDTPEAAAINTRFAELQEAKTALEDDRYRPPAGMKPLPADEYWTRRAEIEAEQEQLQRRRVISREAEPLRTALKQTWTEELWQAQPLDYRRSILRIVCERIEVTRKIGHGGAEMGHLGAVHNPDRIKVKLAG
jgi:hypothetical protein